MLIHLFLPHHYVWDSYFSLDILPVPLSQMLTVSSVSHSPLSADYISGLQGFALLGPVRKDWNKFFLNASSSLDNHDRQTHTICVTFELCAKMDGSNNNVFYASLQSPFFLIFII